MTCISHSKLSKNIIAQQFYYGVILAVILRYSCTFYIYMHSKGFSTAQSVHQMAGPGGIKVTK